MDGHRRRHIGGVASSIENLREAEGLNAPLKSETMQSLDGNRQDFKTCYVWILVRIEWCVVLGTAAVALARRSARVPVYGTGSRVECSRPLPVSLFERLAVDSCSRHVTPPITRIVFMRPNRTPHWVLRRSQPHPKGGRPTRAQPQPETECAAARALRGGSPGGRGA